MRAGHKVRRRHCIALVLVTAGLTGVAACGSDAEEILSEAAEQPAAGDLAVEEAVSSESEAQWLGSLEQGLRVCTPGQRRCVNNRVPQVCNSAGTAFVTQPACSGNQVRSCEGPLANGTVVFFNFDCDDFDSCTADSCNAATRSCVNTPRGGPPGCACTSSAQCLGGGVCAAGRCSIIR